MKEDSTFFTKRKRFWENLAEARIHLPQSFSKLYRAIRESGYPTISRTTVQRHLNRMMKEHVLIKYPKIGRRYNETLYGLDIQMLEVYRWKRVALSLEVVAKTLDRRMKHLEDDWEQEQQSIPWILRESLFSYNPPKLNTIVNVNIVNE